MIGGSRPARAEREAPRYGVGDGEGVGLGVAVGLGEGEGGGEGGGSSCWTGPSSGTRSRHVRGHDGPVNWVTTHQE